MTIIFIMQDEEKSFNPLSLILKLLKKGLNKFTPPWVDEITTDPVTFTGQTGKLSRHSHLTIPLSVIQPSNSNYAKTLQHPRQRPQSPLRQTEQVEQKTNYRPTKPKNHQGSGV